MRLWCNPISSSTDAAPIQHWCKYLRESVSIASTSTISKLAAFSCLGIKEPSRKWSSTSFTIRREYAWIHPNDVLAFSFAYTQSTANTKNKDILRSALRTFWSSIYDFDCMNHHLVCINRSNNLTHFTFFLKHHYDASRKKNGNIRSHLSSIILSNYIYVWLWIHKFVVWLKFPTKEYYFEFSYSAVLCSGKMTECK